MKHRIIIIFFLAIANVLSAQENVYYSEDELRGHAAFMDAMVQKYQGNDDKAIELFKQILKADAKNHSVAFEIAKLQIIKGNLNEAIRYAEKALVVESDNKWYLILLSNTLMENNEYNKAIPYLQQLKAQDKGNRDYYEDLAYCYLKEKNSDQAIIELNALELIIGVDEANIKKKYDIYRAKDDKLNAENELQKLIAANPSNTTYLNNLATFYKRTTQQEKAKATYLQILELDPDDTHANLAIAAELNEQSNASAYLLSLKNILENPEISIDSKINELVPHIESLGMESDSALVRSLDNSLNSLRLSHPGSAKAYAISGDFYSRIKKDDKAIEFYERTIDINDNIYSVWEQLLYSLNVKKDYKALSQKSLTAVDLFPNQATAYIMHARALIELNKTSEAKEYLMEARLIAGKNTDLIKQIEVLSQSIK